MSKLAAFRRGWASLSHDFRGKGSSTRPLGIFLVSKKLDTFAVWQCKLHRATCSRFDTIPACDRRTDRQTDGIAARCKKNLDRARKGYARAVDSRSMTGGTKPLTSSK